MPNILRAVSNEMAAFKTESRAFQTQLLSLQDILADNTQKCYQNQMGDIRYRSYLEGAFQAAAFGYSFYSPDSKMNEMISAVGRTFSSSVFDPRKLDNDNATRKNDSFAQQTTRMIQALDQLRQTQDTAEQAMQNNRQQATTA
jgi:hypothetical protein